MDLSRIVTPLPANTEIVPGHGLINSVTDGARLRVFAEAYAKHHQPTRIKVILSWPLPHVAKTCRHCAAPWPCSSYTWAEGVLNDGQTHR